MSGAIFSRWVNKTFSVILAVLYLNSLLAPAACAAKISVDDLLGNEAPDLKAQTQAARSSKTNRPSLPAQSQGNAVGHSQNDSPDTNEINPDLFEPSGQLTAGTLSVSTAGSGAAGAGGSGTQSSINQFQFDPVSGAGVISLPIETPPGRQNLKPSLTLTYSPRGENRYYGVGWDVGFGYIARSIKDRVPVYDDDIDEFIAVIDGKTMDLIEISEGRYRARIGALTYNFEFDGYQWIMRNGKGLTYYFGQDQLYGDQSRRCYGEPGPPFWHLSKVMDSSGNYYIIRHLFSGEFEIYWSGEPGTDQDGVDTESQNFYARVEAFYEDSKRHDQMSLRRHGFLDIIGYRIKEIKVSVLGELQKRYAFGYGYSQRTGRSLLKQITTYGADGVTARPAIQFAYEEAPITYSLISQQGDPLSGDNLWNARYRFGLPFGNNQGPLWPGAIQPEETVYTQASGNLGGSWWEHNGHGSFNHGNNMNVGNYYWTYVYSETEQTLNVPFQMPQDSIPAFWINGDYSQLRTTVWELQKGYNLIEYVNYHRDQWFWFYLNFNLADHVDLMNSVQLVLPQLAGDFNGDGLTDVATYFPDAGNVKVEISTGNAFLPKTTWLDNIGENHRVLIGDVNADGRTDLVLFDETNGNWEPAFSDGTQFVRQGLWLSGFGANQQVALADINVDGRADAVRMFAADGAKKIQIALNHESYFEADPEILLIGNEDSYEIVMGDFNGDGMVDFGSFDPATGNWRAIQNKRGTPDSLDIEGSDYLLAFDCGAGMQPLPLDFNNDGTTDFGYYDAQNGTISYKASYGGIIDATIRTVPVTFNLTGDGLQLQSGDFNGDGVIDYITFNALGEIEFAYSDGSISDVLTEVDNGLGGVTTIEYVPSSVFPNTYLPFVMPLVSAVTLGNSRDYTVRTRYEYEGGLWNPDDREFYGFNKVRVYDADDNYVETEFYQNDSALRGYPKSKQFVTNDGAMLSKSVNDWRVEELSEIAPDITFACLKRTDQFEYDAQGGARRRAEEYFYEQEPQYGHPTRVISYGEVDVDTGDDIGTDRIWSQTQYVNNTNENVWLIGFPAQVDHYFDGGVGPYLTEVFAYDGQAAMVSPVKGLTTTVSLKQYEPDEQTITKNFLYDGYGNQTQMSDFNGNAAAVIYDNDFHMFPVVERNALNQEMTFEYYGVDGVPMGDFSAESYSGLFGQEKSVTDINATQEQYNYDVFGRRKQVVGPRDTLALPGIQNQYDDFNDYVRVVTEKRLEYGTSRSAKSVAFLDGLGGLIQSRNPSGQEGRYIISGEKKYDSRGKVTRQYNPRATSQAQDVLEDVIPPALAYTRYDYDEAGRPVTVTNPDGTYMTQAYYVGKTVGIDANGHQQISYSDVRGNVIKREEYAGADGRCARYAQTPYTLYATTQYSYDYSNQLVRTIDAHGNTSDILYDGFGRKIAMDDPDMGHWEYGYDDNGNLLWQRDPRGQRLDFSYDNLNRLVRKTDHEWMDVTYHYDMNPQINGAGRLGLVEYGQSAGNNNTQFLYDEFGRETHSLKVIDGISYSVAREYDAMSHLLSLQYPDGSAVQYHYDDSGRLYGILGDGIEYVTDIAYNVMGQIQQVSFGTGTVTQYFYNDKTFRLERIYTIDNQNQAIQDLNYFYDALGNIVKVEDYIYGGTQEFRYDHLSRLIEASSPDTYGTKVYAYDEIGNILEKDGRTYVYGENEAGPHAVTSLSDESIFGYGPNGNMLMHHSSRGDFFYQFDSENRLKSVIQNGHQLVKFGYDGDGGRVKKVVFDALEGVPASQMAYPELLEGGSGGQDLVTHFVGRLYERDNLHEIKHIYLGNDRIVSVRDGVEQYIHTDHLGSTHVVEDETGNPTNLNQYKPFGEFSRRISLQEEDQKSGLYFTQQMLDDETGLYYYGARYYDPMLGRFISADSIVQAPLDPQTLNRYSYCRNNPVLFVDPSGNIFGIDDIIIGAIIGAVIGGVSSGIQTDWNWEAVGAGALTGAVGGAVFSVVAPALNTFTTNIMRNLSLGAGTTGPLSAGWTMAANFTSNFAAGAASGSSVMAVSGGNRNEIGEAALFGGAFAGGLSAIRDTAQIMRAKMVQQSRIDPRNASGKSVGMFGDGFKLGGGRYDPTHPNGNPSPLGGHQGGVGQIFGMRYKPGSFWDRLVETYAGPHDFLNSWGYDAFGNLQNHVGFERFLGMTLNPLNVVIATPIALPSVIPPSAYSAPSVIYGNSKAEASEQINSEGSVRSSLLVNK